MELVANREALYAGFQRVGSVVSSSIQQPMYRNVKVQAADGIVYVSATDLEVGLTLKVTEVEVQQEGAALLPHSRVSPILGATPDEEITFREDDGSVVIETGDSNFRILGEDPADFPETPVLPADGTIEIDPDTLKYMIRRTAFATAGEKGRYALNGVLFVVGKDETIELVAADGARLAHVKKKVSNPDGTQAEFIVMTRGVEQLAKLADYGQEPLRFAASENQLLAENDAGRLVCQLVEGQFPNYQEVVPADSKVKVQLPTKELLSAVHRASFLTTDQTRVVDFHFGQDGLTITAESPDVGRAEVRMPLEYDGDEVHISFNPEFVEDMLGIVQRDTVKLRFTDRRSPCVIKSGLDYTYVISPVIREEAEL
ncbi:MAG: DNA polymerase III subunit beta [Planctomycetota bacterium]|jgi:DNA polymerase-3 subunit beta